MTAAPTRRCSVESFNPKLILVPTDLSDPAAHALRYASALGKRLGAHLLVIYADLFLPPVDFSASAAGVFDASRDVMAENAREELQAHAEKNIARDVPFDVRVIIDDPLDAIVAQVRESGAELIIMGTHGRTGVRRLMFGSVTEGTIRIAPVPVIAVNKHTSESPDVTKVLSPITFTPASRDALRYAAALTVGHEDAPLVVLRNVDDDDAQMGAHQLARLEAWLPAELAKRCELKLVGGEDPSEQIVHLAKVMKADLIAFGIPAGRSIADSLRGTIAERVVQHSECPVLTVNAYAARVLPAKVVEERELVAAG